MEQNNHKFRLRLNLFDAIILVAVLLVEAAALWIGLRSGGDHPYRRPGTLYRHVSEDERGEVPSSSPATSWRTR